MPLVWKEVCRPNTPTVYIDQATGRPRTAVFTPEFIKHLHDSGKAMLADGLSIPVPLEHQGDATVMTRAQKAAANLKNNAGWVSDFSVTGDGRLFTQLDVQDEEIYRKLPRTIRYVSPMIEPRVVDGNGKEWQGVVTHMALTSRPRITKQSPFGSVAAALSMAQPDVPLAVSGAALPACGLCFSAAGSLRRGAPGRAPGPLYPAAFSVLTGMALAEEFDGGEGRPKEKKPPEKKEGGEKRPPEGKKPVGEGKEAPKFGEGGEEGEGGHGKGRGPVEDMMDVAAEMISAIYGVEIEDCNTPEEFANCLVKALMQKLREEKGNDMPETPAAPPPAPAAPPPAPAAPAAAPVQESPPVYMSMEQVNQIADPQHRLTALAAFSLQQQTQRLMKNVYATAAASREARLERVCKLIPKESADYLRAEHAKVKARSGMGFSVGDDGAIADEFEAMLKFAEGLPRLPAFLCDEQAARFATEVPQPADALDRNGAGREVPLSKEKAREVSAELMRNSGIKAEASK